MWWWVGSTKEGPKPSLALESFNVIQERDGQEGKQENYSMRVFWGCRRWCLRPGAWCRDTASLSSCPSWSQWAQGSARGRQRAQKGLVLITARDTKKTSIIPCSTCPGCPRQKLVAPSGHNQSGIHLIASAPSCQHSHSCGWSGNALLQLYGGLGLGTFKAHHLTPPPKEWQPWWNI